MGIQYSCPNCGAMVCLNSWTTISERGWCSHCDLNDLRKVAAAAKTARRKYASDLRDRDEEITRLKFKLAGMLPEPAPCTRCRCPACRQAEAITHPRLTGNGGFWI